MKALQDEWLAVADGLHSHIYVAQKREAVQMHAMSYGAGVEP